MEKEYKKIENRAVYYISKRDYGIEELKEKIRLKMPESDSELIEKAVQKMTEYGYMCDDRFVEGFIRNEKMNHNGPLKIRMKLKQKKIKDEIIDEYLDPNEDDFYKSCVYNLEKKSNGLIKDMKEKQKLYRFLASKGFLSDHISNAFSILKE